jgi:hypothetical protein
MEGDLEPKKNKTPLILAAAGVLIVGGVGGVLALGGKSKPNPNAPTAGVQQPTQQITPKDEKIKISVTSDPPGAKVFRADTGKLEDGTTPLSFTIKKGDPEFDIQVKLDGFRPGVKSLHTDKDQAVLVSLEKNAVPQPTEPQQPTPPTETAEVVKPDKDKKKHHSSSGDKADKPAKKDKSDKGAKEEGGDDMKLLQPKF